jgi:hypothetical protein
MLRNVAVRVMPILAHLTTNSKAKDEEKYPVIF